MHNGLKNHVGGRASKQKSTMHTPFELMYGRYSTHYIFIRTFNTSQIFVLERIVCADTHWNNMTRFPYMPYLMYAYAYIICNGMDTYIFIITLVHKILFLCNRKAVLPIENLYNTVKLNLLMRITLKKFSKTCVPSENKFFQMPSRIFPQHRHV